MAALFEDYRYKDVRNADVWNGVKLSLDDFSVGGESCIRCGGVGFDANATDWSKDQGLQQALVVCSKEKEMRCYHCVSDGNKNCKICGTCGISLGVAGLIVTGSTTQ